MGRNDTVVEDEPDERDLEARDWIGVTLDDRYQITGVLGSGAFGHVFSAKHLVLGREVALKVLAPEGEFEETMLARFRREADLLARLTHPGIVTATDYGVSEGRPYLVMELVEGQNLRHLIDDRGPLSLGLALAIAKQLLRALAYAHGQGVLHRDLKPGNVIVALPRGGEPRVKVLDFGLAKLAEPDESGAPPLTVRGTAFGTPGYVAPEVLAARGADARADVYAVGVMLFEMLGGRRPFAAETRALELRLTLSAPVPRLADLRPKLQLAADLDSILQRALARDPAERPADAQSMLDALDALGTPPPEPEPEPKPVRWYDKQVPLSLVIVLVASPTLVAVILAIALAIALLSD